MRDFRLYMCRVKFKEPSEVSFDKANLSGVSFLLTDVSKLSFLREVWPREKGVFGRGRAKVVDEDTLREALDPKQPQSRIDIDVDPDSVAQFTGG